jgi:hypothetical protein
MMSQPTIPYPQLPSRELPRQPHYDAWCTAWDAYDVPRIWDSVAEEDDAVGWGQVNGFRNMADELAKSYEDLRRSRETLAAAWQSPAAAAMLARIDHFTESLLLDARCAATTATALDGIMDTLAKARMNVVILKRRWDSVTSDWIPEFWDNAAADLNEQAAVIMSDADQAIRDYRTQIITPDTARGVRQEELSAQLPGDPLDASASSGGKKIPPIPGYSPVGTANSSRDAQAPADPELAGMPRPVYASPGEPVSMLPVPPGNPHAPYGGAYILPGPGVGRSGYLVPMPGNGSSGRATPIQNGQWGAGRSAMGRPSMIGGGALSGGGLMPMAMGSVPPASGQSQGGRDQKGKADTTWEVERGVPPVIEGIATDAYIPGLPSAQQEDAFKDWFAELAYPWQSQSTRDSGQPHIVIRKTQT